MRVSTSPSASDVCQHVSAPSPFRFPRSPREGKGEGDAHTHRRSRALLEVAPLRVAAALLSSSLVDRIPATSLRYACRGHPTRPLHICGARLSSSAALVQRGSRRSIRAWALGGKRLLCRLDLFCRAYAGVMA